MKKVMRPIIILDPESKEQFKIYCEPQDTDRVKKFLSRITETIIDQRGGES